MAKALRNALGFAQRTPGRIATMSDLLAAIVPRLSEPFASISSVHGLAPGPLMERRPGPANAAGPEGEPRAEPRFSKTVERAVERAWSLAQGLHSRKLHLEHLFLSILQEDGAEFREPLGALVVFPQKLRAEVERALREAAPAEPPPAGWLSTHPLCLSTNAWAALRAARAEAARQAQDRIGAGHVLWTLLGDEQARASVLEALRRRPASPGPEPPRFDAHAADAIERARWIAHGMGHEEIDVDHLLHATLSLDGAALREVLPWPIDEARRVRQGVWERLHGRCLPLVPRLGQARTLSADAIAAIRRANELVPCEPKGRVQPQHLLLALHEQTRGAGARLLARLRTDRDALALLQERLPSTGPTGIASHSVLLSASTVAVVAMAAEEAYALGCAQVDTDHLLLGLLRSTDSVACRALACVGVRLEDARIAALEEALAPET